MARNYNGYHGNNGHQGYDDDSNYDDSNIERLQRRRRRPELVKTGRKLPQKKKSPFLLRLLSWLGIFLMCFVAGYIGTSYMMDKLNQKLFLKPENRVSNEEDLNALREAEQERARTATTGSSGESVQQVALNIYYIQGNTLAVTQRSFVARAQEDNISDALRTIFDLSGISGADKINILHVFRNGDMAFLDLSASFASTLSSMEQQSAQLLLTGIVRTLQENFSPITKTRFLIESQAPKSGGPVDLTALWQLPGK